jgi:hypothetical protein
MHRLARLLWTFVLLGLTLVFAGWGSLALYFRAPFGEGLRWPTALAWAFLMLLILAEVLVRRRRARAVLVLAISIAGILAWWSSILPSNDRDWSPDVSRPALASIEGNTLTVRDVRTFEWRSDTDYTAAWEDRTYDLGSLQGLDLWSSTWAGEDIAHILVSFDFGAAIAPLTWSIELRREKGEPYSALAGFFKQAELIAIAADERDIIRVRTNIRHEDVRLYRLNAGPAASRAVLDTYVAAAAKLATEPRWYNTLTTNCTTAVFQIAKAVQPGIPLDWRVLLSGHFAAYAYDRGALDTALPFPDLKRNARVNERALAADALPQPAFSQMLRDGIPDPKSQAPARP